MSPTNLLISEFLDQYSEDSISFKNENGKKDVTSCCHDVAVRYKYVLYLAKV